MSKYTARLFHLISVPLLVLSLAWSVAACDGDEGGDPPAKADAGGAADARPPGPPDATVPPPVADAALPPPVADAAPAGTVEAMCAALCTKLEECFGEPNPECPGECVPAAATCTPEELAALTACASGTCETLGNCRADCLDK